jgi:hypothetical protein
MKVIVALMVMLLCIGTANAALNEQDQGQLQGQQQGQGQLQGQSQGQSQGQGQDQGQLQGQAQAAIAAQGQVSVGKVKTGINIIEEDSDAAPDSIAFPSTGATEGVASANASYMFGNLGLSDTEMYKKGSHIIQTVLAIPEDILPREEKIAIVKDVVAKMQKSVKPRRLLGIGPEQHSKNLLNLFGLLSMDSVWADGQRPFQRKKDIGR